jgi:hypothetical protein
VSLSLFLAFSYAPAHHHKSASTVDTFTQSDGLWLRPYTSNRSATAQHHRGDHKKGRKKEKKKKKKNRKKNQKREEVFLSSRTSQKLSYQLVKSTLNFSKGVLSVVTNRIVFANQMFKETAALGFALDKSALQESKANQTNKTKQFGHVPFCDVLQQFRRFLLELLCPRDHTDH